MQQGQGLELCESFVTRSPAETRSLGEQLAPVLRLGDLVAVSGELGAGKTVFAKGVGVGLGLEPRAVRSPTFQVVAEHPDARLLFVHVDAYRLFGADALLDLGLEQVLRADAAVLVEWAERVRELLPPDRLDVWLEHAGGDVRRWTVRASGPRGARMARALGRAACEERTRCCE